MEAVCNINRYSCVLWAWVQYNDLAQLCNDSRAKAVVLSEMDAAGRDAQVSYSFYVTLTFTLQFGLVFN